MTTRVGAAINLTNRSCCDITVLRYDIQRSEWPRLFCSVVLSVSNCNEGLRKERLKHGRFNFAENTTTSDWLQ